jgi:hypothetical protein
VYLIYVLIRGGLSGFYPCPFINVAEIGLVKTLLNSALLMLFFILVTYLFIVVGKKAKKSLLPTKCCSKPAQYSTPESKLLCPKI